jgi:hypothetical protein
MSRGLLLLHQFSSYTMQNIPERRVSHSREFTLRETGIFRRKLPIHLTHKSGCNLSDFSTTIQVVDSLPLEEVLRSPPLSCTIENKRASPSELCSSDSSRELSRTLPAFAFNDFQSVEVFPDSALSPSQKFHLSGTQIRPALPCMTRTTQS